MITLPMWRVQIISEPMLNLLLFLSALLAGVTGAISGHARTDVPAVQQSAAQVCEIFVESAIQIPALAPIGMPRIQSSAHSGNPLVPGWPVKTFLFSRDIGQVLEKLLV